MIYSLPAKVLEVSADNTVTVSFRDNSKVQAIVSEDKKIAVGQYVSIIGIKGEYEICGDPIKPAHTW